MNFFKSAILGLIQGMTEFIPVSSTGHLIVARELLGLPIIGTITFDAILQLATAFAALIYFWKDIWNIIKGFRFWFLGFRFKNIEMTQQEKDSNNLFLALVIGTIPAIVLGLFLQKYMDTIFRGNHVVAITLILGAILFYFAEKFNKKDHILHSQISLEVSSAPSPLTLGFVVGLFQCLALIPGFSRSGSTISGGLFLGLNRGLAARFSFLLSMPIIFGSGLKKLFDLYQTGTLAEVESSLIIASIFAFISGLFAIHFLIKFLKNHSLNYFGVYRIILAVIILIWL